MESETSHLHKKWRKHTSRAPLSSSLVQDSNFESSVLLGELSTEILLRLQVKHLLKFKCVSKSDCSINYLFYDHVTWTIDVDYLPKISYESIKFVGSVNGLICVAIEEKNVFLGIRQLGSSRNCLVLEPIPFTCMVLVTMSFMMTISLNSNSWKCLDDKRNAIQIYKSGMLVNGKLHWDITNKVSINYNDCVILVVDLADERWKEIENPCYREGTFYSIPYLCVLGNELSMILSIYHESGRCMGYEGVRS
ncbi:hypothetical protein H5410_049002 [Solanum commersonii]|uniref:F-box associated beta-propeller type 1 domain-containing protein n=1 Tax=Solanum commersonii TaxID=4109 RepID=A0A9J5XNC1_SOLCO|nr:hypothetical protein H5410_049002 [Solanum commersonii]